jgi:hypothetical protein
MFGAMGDDLEHHFAFADEEDHFRFLTRMQDLALGAFIRQKIDPVDIMLVFHRMEDAADLDIDLAVFLVDERHMLLFAFLFALWIGSSSISLPQHSGMQLPS